MSKMFDKGNDALAEGRIEARPQGIFVLGMHRSGTSACTRVLNLLGCALSDELLGAGEGNETGHWEPVRAVALNDEILASAGSSHEDWGPINADWRTSAIRSTMVQRASEVIADHAKLGPLFAIKDPRICRLADVWLEAAADAEIEPLVVLMLRNPVEVAASLETRDLMANGYSDLLWLRHVLDAELFSREHKRVICRYDELMANWRKPVAKIKDELGVSFPRNSPKVHREISQFLTPDQRHHQSDAAALIDNPAYSHWLRKTFQIMLDWSENGENANDYPILDEIRSELDRAHGAFAQLLLTLDVTGSVGAGGHLRWELSALREEAERKDLSLRHAAQEVEELRASSALKEAELAERLHVEATQARNLESEIERLNAVLASRTASDEEATALRSELSGRINELASLQSTLNETQAGISAERELRANAENQLAETSRELEEQQQRNSELVDQVTSSQTELLHVQEKVAALLSQLDEADQVRLRAEALDAELAKTTAELANARDAINSAHIEVNAERERSVSVQERLSEASRELHEHQLRNAELTGQITTLQSTLTQRQEELAQLLSQLHEAERGRARAEMECEQEREQRMQFKLRIQETEAEISAARADLERERSVAVQKIDALANDLAKLTMLLQRQEGATEQAQGEGAKSAAEAARLFGEVQRLNSNLVTAQSARVEAESKLVARFEEIAQLTSIVTIESNRADALEGQAQWLTAVRRLEEGFPAWWAIMPRAWRERRAHLRFYRAGLFDADAYLSLYPDVAAASMDPVRHYILHGMAEERLRPQPS